MRKPRLAESPTHVVYAVVEERIRGNDVCFSRRPHRRHGAGAVGELEEPVTDGARQNVVRFPRVGPRVRAVTPRGAPWCVRGRRSRRPVIGAPRALCKGAALCRRQIVCETEVARCWRGVAPRCPLRERTEARVACGARMRPGPPGWPARWLQGLADSEAVPWASTGGLAVCPSEKMPVRSSVGAEAAAPRPLTDPPRSLCDAQRARLTSPI